MAGGSQGKHEVGVNGREYAQRAAPELHAGKNECREQERDRQHAAHKKQGQAQHVCQVAHISLTTASGRAMRLIGFDP